MLKNINIGTVIGASMAGVVLALTAIFIPVALNNTGKVIEESAQRELQALYQTARAEIESEGRLAQTLSAFVANLEDVRTYFARGDRQALETMMTPPFQVMKNDYAARQFQFHTPPATSFLRIHKPEKYGDDLSAFRSTVVQANATRQPVQGLEQGVAGFGIRGIAPVSAGDVHLGTVEFGMSFGQPFFDQFKQKYKVDIALYVPDAEKGFKAFGTTMPDAAMLSDAELQHALSSAPVMHERTYNATSYAVYAHAIPDFSGKPVGVIGIAMDRSHYVAAMAQARNTILLIGLGGLATALVLTWLIARAITRPLSAAVLAMNDIAEGNGDLTLRLDDSGGNEIGRLGGAFNRFAEKVRGTVTQVSVSTAQLTDAAEQVASVTQETSHGVQQQHAETEQVATAMNEMTATVHEVARNASDAAGAADNADQEANKGRRIVTDTIRVIELLAGDVKSAEAVIDKLAQDSENIGGVLDVIRGIAEQTNLLALNAAIEAARAGEQGRGFAVVADEVRTLASRTQESTQEIQQMIEQLQSGAHNAVSVMQQSSARAQEGVEEAARAGASLDAITRAVATISDMNAQIATAAEEQSAVAEEINRNIVNISQVVEQTAQGATRTSGASAELARLASGLQALMRQFKT